ncbi:hypothetical protein ACOME3_002296 [Neoechinorhynchus agilis]
MISNMRLITHNILSTNFLKNVKKGYPLMIKATEVKETESKKFNPQIVRRTIERLDWKTFIGAARGLQLIKEDKGVNWDEMPQEEQLKDESFLSSIHRLLFNVEIVKGELVCPETGRVFPIKNSIPNMLIEDAER